MQLLKVRLRCGGAGKVKAKDVGTPSQHLPLPSQWHPYCHSTRPFKDQCDKPNPSASWWSNMVGGLIDGIRERKADVGHSNYLPSSCGDHKSTTGSCEPREMIIRVEIWKEQWNVYKPNSVQLGMVVLCKKKLQIISNSGGNYQINGWVPRRNIPISWGKSFSFIFYFFFFCLPSSKPGDIAQFINQLLVIKMVCNIMRRETVPIN